jgi:GTP pyrophosphokinase
MAEPSNHSAGARSTSDAASDAPSPVTSKAAKANAPAKVAAQAVPLPVPDGWTGDAMEAPVVIAGAPTVDELVATLRSYLPESDHQLVRRAYAFAARCHAGQVRKSGEPYFAHPVAVAFLLTRLRLDGASISAGLLHDVAEDTTVSIDEIAQRFNGEIAAIVDGVTKLDKIKFASREQKQAENFRKMLVAMSRDIRVLLIKLADRMHNMSTLLSMRPDQQRRIAQETLEIYAPLANRLGIGWMKAQLEDLCFRHLHQEEYRKLAALVGQRVAERQAYVDEVVGELRKILGTEGLSGADVSGRPKHLYGIWRKMTAQNVTYDQIYDAQGFRVLVEDLKECYAALGAVHTAWKPIPGRFKDYIALPKANRYQSLHTSVIGPYAERIEVQIRTREMHRVAEEGVAAHWRYKERGESIAVRDEERFAWLKQLLEWHVGVKDSDEFLDSMKVDLFADEVYTFTPKGDVKVLPRGATPVDFAYAIHTKVGERCVGAKVDGAMVPLRHQLRNGNIIDILTRQDAHPSSDWLEFVVTARARTKIRTYIHAEQRQRALEVGTDLLEKAFRRVRFSLSRVQSHEKFPRLLQHFGVSSFDDLAVLVGYGKVEAADAATWILPEEKLAEPVVETPQVKRPRKADKKKSGAAITVSGYDDVLVRFGKCCAPVPGDPIVGVVTRGRGITIHARGCPQALAADSLRRLDCEWNRETGAAATVMVRVYSENEAGLLAAMSARFTEAGIDIQSAHCRVVEGRKAVNDFEVTVSSIDQLQGVIASLSRLKGVTRVERVRG